MDLEDLVKRFAILWAMLMFLLIYTVLYNSYQKRNNPQPYPYIEKHFYGDTCNQIQHKINTK